MEVIESHGPRYLGLGVVRAWADEWFKDGKVNRWDMGSVYENGDTLFYEWTFECVSGGKEYYIEGCSIVQFKDGKIKYLREYMTSKPVFEWQPS